MKLYITFLSISFSINSHTYYKKYTIFHSIVVHFFINSQHKVNKLSDKDQQYFHWQVIIIILQLSFLSIFSPFLLLKKDHEWMKDYRNMKENFFLLLLLLFSIQKNTSTIAKVVWNRTNYNKIGKNQKDNNCPPSTIIFPTSMTKSI